MGGWRNTLSAIARQHEHAADRVTRADAAGGPRHGSTTGPSAGKAASSPGWSTDSPSSRSTIRIRCAARRTGTSRVSGWESKVNFDNLKIRPL